MRRNPLTLLIAAALCLAPSFALAQDAPPGEAPTPDEVAVSDDGKAAFIALAGGRTGLVHAIGARYVTRILQPQAVRDLRFDENGGLGLRLRQRRWCRRAPGSRSSRP